MPSAHKLIFIPGLGDHVGLINFCMPSWTKQGYVVSICGLQWRDGKAFKPKLQHVVDQIDAIHHKEARLSLIGMSAGGSATVNALLDRPDKVYGVVNICGRLRDGNHKGFRSLVNRSVGAPAFSESVKLCESRLANSSKQDRAKIMTLRARFGDELVPSDTSLVTGGYNVSVPVAEHGLTIAIALTLWRHAIMQFLDSNDIATS